MNYNTRRPLTHSHLKGSLQGATGAKTYRHNLSNKISFELERMLDGDFEKIDWHAQVEDFHLFKQEFLKKSETFTNEAPKKPAVASIATKPEGVTEEEK